MTLEHQGPAFATPRAFGRAHAAAGVALLALLLATPAAAGAPKGLGASADAAQRAIAARSLRGLDGKPMTLASKPGEVVVVNFWASWCAPCRRELPRLAKLNRELAGRGARVVAISIDRDAENARRFCKSQGVSLPVAHDGPEGLARQLDLKSVPLTLVLDGDGRIAYSTTGSDEAALAQVAAAAHRLLGGSAAAATTEGSR